ncbi:MAG: hypothetical protein HDR24_07285 [Lachnospiraceae bacterium]|nr:hypothetical protein [Lachnospiraceae bacterium]
MKKIFELNDKLLDEEKVNVFYGTGKQSKERMESLIKCGLKCDYLGDNDEKNWNAFIDGKRCLSHDEIRSRDNLNIIIGSKAYEKKIEERMLGFGLLPEQIFYDNYKEELSDRIFLKD